MDKFKNEALTFLSISEITMGEMRHIKQLKLNMRQFKSKWTGLDSEVVFT